MMRKKVLALALMLILVGLPLVARWFYYYEGTFAERDIPRPDLDAIKVPTPNMLPFTDRYGTSSSGTILIDMAHKNRFEMPELNVLQARLSARGQRIEPVGTTEDLAQKLRYAKALVIISPGERFSPKEIQLISTFVDKGGRLLVLTDPTRFTLRLDDYGEVVGLDSDVVFVNDLVFQFGLVFQSDYLYNTVENEGNFRNIKLTDLAVHDLTAGLKQVVFYATHSIVSEEPALIAAGGDTRSSSSERAEELAVAVLGADGAVLALGDLTFMSEPYNTVYDNDGLIANIADFLSGAQRQYELVDFPFFFDDQVDLVYAGAPLLDSDFLMGSGSLQVHFADKGKELTIRETEDPAHDTLFLGLYARIGEVDSYLALAGVTFLITPTQALEEEAQPDATPAPPLTPTVGAPVDLSGPLTGTLGLTLTPEVTATLKVSPLVGSRVEIASLGQMVMTGTALLTLQTYGERQVLVLLANTEAGLDDVVKRLTAGDLEDCLLWEAAVSPPASLALCPADEVASGEGVGGWPGPRPSPVPTLTPTPTISPTPPVTDTIQPTEPVRQPEGNIIVVSFDAGEGRYDTMTGAADYAQILSERYNVIVWSVAQDGLPAAGDQLEHDLVIWTTGDFENVLGDAEGELLLPVLLGGKPIILSGAYLDEVARNAVQRDIQVKDATHPVAQGFEPGEVIPFVSAPSGSEYEINVLETELTVESDDVFIRGPDSEAAGAPSVTVAKEQILGARIAVIGFPLYLLPQEAKTRLVLNTVDWLLSSSE